MGSRYKPPKLVLFNGQVGSACGMASAATGPFYCPGDQDVYLDTAFFQELSQRFGAPGDFARAYVIAHEVGHHVQNQLGLMADVAKRSAARVRADAQRAVGAPGVAGGLLCRRVGQFRGQARARSTRRTSNRASPPPAAVGDDRIQQRSRGYVVPESFTHGSSAQRVKWFKIGLQSGDLRQCNTFAARDL